MPLDRTWFNTLVDDSGTGTDGTIWNKAQIDNLLDVIDLGFAAGNASTVVLNSDTGTINGWAPGLAGNTIVLWTGASAMTVNGIAGGSRGQVLVVRNAGSAVAYFTHFEAAAVAASQSLANCVQIGHTPIANGGSIVYQYIESNWQLINHEQGMWIPQPFNAAHFMGSGGMAWTVAGGDVVSHRYRVDGRTLDWNLAVNGTLSGSPSNFLAVTLPGIVTTFTSAAITRGVLGHASLSTGFEPCVSQTTAGGTTMLILRGAVTNFPLGAVSVSVSLRCEII